MSAIQERSLTESEAAEFKRRANQAWQNLGLVDSDTTPEAAVAAVDAFVDRWQNERRGVLGKLRASRGPNSTDVALGLGAVWGDQHVRQLAWEWTCLIPDGRELYAVVSPDRSMVVYATYFLKQCLENSAMDCTAALSFNMLVAGKITGLPAGGCEDILRRISRVIPKR